MGTFKLQMPKMGESVIEATILTWHKKPGESISENEVLLEVATDKVDTDVPCPVSGTVKEILFHEGDVVPVGEVLATIETEGEDSDDEPALEQKQAGEAMISAPAEEKGDVAPEAQKPATPQEVPYVPKPATPPPPPKSAPPAGRFYSPLVLNIAQTEGIPLAELEQVPGTGLDGRITKDDILQYIEERKKSGPRQPAQAPAPQAPPQQSAPQQQSAPPQEPPPPQSAPVPPNPPSPPPAKKPAAIPSGQQEIVEMDRMRKLIAKNMIESKHTSAHVSSFIEADLTTIVQWREKNKDVFQQKEGVKLTFMPFFVEAVANAIREFPMINISVQGEQIIKKGDINIGIATALPSGNLIVPVIKNADELNLAGIAKAMDDLVNRARNNKLTADDIDGGTYTITNLGSFGNTMGTPIILQPQVAIMGVGAVIKKPVVMETELGDVIAIRHMMYLSHTYDHRVVDGMLGGQFVKKVAENLEQFDPNRTI